MSQQINLFNPAFVPQRRHFSLMSMLQGWAVVLLGIGAMYGYAVLQVEQLGRQQHEGEKLLETSRKQLAGLAAKVTPQRSGEQLQEEVRLLEKQVNDQVELVTVMQSGALGNSTGYSEYMRAFSRQVVQGLWLTGFRIGGEGKELSLSGGVVNPDLLPQYIQRLRREGVMQGKSFDALQMKSIKTDKAGASAGYVQFVLHSGAEEAEK